MRIAAMLTCSLDSSLSELPVDTPSKIAKRSAAGIRLSRGVTLGFGFLRRQLWIWPLLAAVMLAVGGLVIRSSVESAAQMEMAEGLQAILNSNVEALKIWLETEEAHVTAAANEVEIRRLARELKR